MKILTFSDIDWGGFNYLTDIVKNVQPDLLFLTGDVYTDPLSRYHSKLKEFLDFIESQKLKTLSVKGNWDNDQYDKILHQEYNYIEDISLKIKQVEELNILGLPFDYFRYLKELRKIKKNFGSNIDIVLAHPPTKRRVWIFDLEPSFVFVGHDDRRICSVFNTLFIATNGSPENHAVLNINKNKQKQITIEYREYQNYLKHIEEFPFLKKIEGRKKYKCSFDGHELKWRTEEHFHDRPPHAYPARDMHYGIMFEELIKSKRKGQVTDGLRKLKVPKTLRKEYLNI